MSEPTSDRPEPAGRSIDLSIEVPGTVDEVWQAIATGPGITSWWTAWLTERFPPVTGPMPAEAPRPSTAH